jgi:hypothetical protein
MSFGSFKVFSGVQQALVLALLLVTMMALFYADISLSYKIGIAVFAFSVIVLATYATTILRQQKEMYDQQVNQA